MSFDAIPPYEWVEYCSVTPDRPCHLGRGLTLQEVAVINLVINEGITPSLDDGPSTWRAFPPGRKGACTDYALSKRAALVAFGADPELLAVVAGKAAYPDGRAFHHVVLEYRDAEGRTWVLDNLSADLYTPASRPYAWQEEARQTHGELYWRRT